MRICRFTLADDVDTPRLGWVAPGDAIRDVTPACEALPSLRWPLPPGDQLIAHLTELGPRIEELAKDAPEYARDEVSLLSPVANPGKFICGAGNWKHFGAPFGMMGFMGKVTSALAGEEAGVEISWPDRITVHEPELGFVIGRAGRNIAEEDALDYIAGYTCAFDTTLKPEREDWAFCKSFDTYGTLGPWLVTPDEIGDPAALTYTFRVNGEVRGERCFADLAGGPARMIALASSAMTLHPGDVFMSGAADVAPIAPGDVMELEIPRVGRLEVPVRLSPFARASAEPA
jgi:2,4-didehydro-3-deoxy-L-rhamnonate hydrolase